MKKKKSIATEFTDRNERQVARHDLTRSLTVEAGAGTGKTTLLVDRILSLLRNHKASLEQIVAITFTEKAAGELKIRHSSVPGQRPGSLTTGPGRPGTGPHLHHPLLLCQPSPGASGGGKDRPEFRAHG